MKIKSILGFALLLGLFTSCRQWVNSPEALAIPIVQAVRNDNLGKLESLIPDDEDINEIFAGNPASLGATFYNKYSVSYHRANLKGHLHNDLEIINNISKTNGLNWDDVQIGSVTKEDITDSGASYTRLIIPLRFSKGDYQLEYEAARHSSGQWYLINGIYFTRPTSAVK